MGLNLCNALAASYRLGRLDGGEMRVFLRDRSVLADAVAWEMEQVLAEKTRQGVNVTGKVI